MKKDNKDFERDHDSLKDIQEYQEHMYDPGYYIGTGRVPPTVSAPGNAKPAAVLCLLAAVLFLVLGFLLLFSNVRVASSGLIESDITNKLVGFVILLVLSLFFLLLSLGYFRKYRRYRMAKKSVKSRKRSTRK